MWFVTTAAALKSNWRMLECKRSPLIAVAAKAAGFIGCEGLHHPAETPVWIVAIHAGHCSFRQPVLVGPLKLCPDTGVAIGALFINLRLLSRDKTLRTMQVDRMTRRAGDLAFGVTTLETSNVGRLI
jgi:hypothetical protein